MSDRSAFTGDIDFCPECGAIFPSPGIEDTVSCKVCSFKIDVTEFDGVEIKAQVSLNQHCGWQLDKTKATSTGLTIDRICKKCGNDSMIYATLQTRSADEGQTIFYTCFKCGFQENENS